jgi:hypothetical protein
MPTCPAATTLQAAKSPADRAMAGIFLHAFACWGNALPNAVFYIYIAA